MYIYDTLTYLCSNGTYTHATICQSWDGFHYKPLVSGFSIATIS